MILSNHWKISPDIILNFARIEPGFFRFWMTIRIITTPKHSFSIPSPICASTTPLISNLFANAAKQHGNLSGKNDMLAVSFIGLLLIYATDALQGNRLLDEKTVYQIVHQFMYGIFS